VVRTRTRRVDTHPPSGKILPMKITRPPVAVPDQIDEFVAALPDRRAGDAILYRDCRPHMYDAADFHLAGRKWQENNGQHEPWGDRLHDAHAEIVDALRWYHEQGGAFFTIRPWGKREIIGCIGVRPSKFTPEDFELKRLMVRADHHGRGYGRMLVEAALDWARDHGGCRVVAISSRHERTAAAMYRRIGFREITWKDLSGPEYAVAYDLGRQP
jgi:GNAT superfamily N-acetyltransferase